MLTKEELDKLTREQLISLLLDDWNCQEMCSQKTPKI